jgi:N-acetyltransferase
MTISVRDAEDRDVDLLVSLSRFVQDLHSAALPSYFKQPEPGAVAELFRSRLERTDVRIWIASLGDLAAGYVVSVLRDRSDNAVCRRRRFRELDEISVAPAHRRQGVARALVEHAVSHARLEGIVDVELTSWIFNTDAHTAFQALGFRPMVVRFRHQDYSSPRTPSSAWKAPPIDAKQKLAGTSVRLEPLQRAHAADLALAGNSAEIWSYLAGPSGPFRDTSEATSWIAQVLGEQAAGLRIPYAIISGKTGQAVGSTSFFIETRWPNRTLEIGGTWLTPSVWRTEVNTECKYLLLSHAFEVLGTDRVEFMTDARNTRSQRAIERLGAQREGILRAHMLCPDGYVRDSIYYSILSSEWPAIKDKLRAMLTRDR